ncbi:Sel1 repeat-containing protein [Devosia enhydra]|uniref:Sel1 repeat-containing protein n=1 Tax=Devosia enhydra TaxID=665118 RepID=A0A1K2I1X7_9HYPH|nr:peptidoglycan-binding protein [Devosia enhydra]SFZ86255.1 Sel1 repeat-containing protein [Devosia enhydra]
MARAFSETSPNSPGPGAEQDGWQALRGELLALLDQVEGQVARNGRGAPAQQPPIAQRMRDLRQALPEAALRLPEAPRMPEPAARQPAPRIPQGPASPAAEAADGLRAAIQQIRARHMQQAQPAAAQPQMTASPARQQASPQPRQSYQAPEQPRLDAMAEAVNAFSSRLERLEAEIRTQARNGGNVREVAEQMAQLTQVVELLAGAVGESGQVRRLEAQISGLAHVFSQAPQIDFSALTRRLDDLSGSVSHLADMQIAAADRADAVGRPDAGLVETMGAIEASLRNIYDRIDALERGSSQPSPELERLTGELALVAAALQAGPPEPERLIAMVEGLSERIGGFEARDWSIAGLKDDILSLRETILDSTAPRFATLESRLSTIDDRLDSGFAADRDDTALSQIEAQVRQLVHRMDQTGEQLTGLARLYSEPEPRQELPDFEAIADMIAMRAETVGVEAQAQTAEALRRIESRIAELAAIPEPGETDSDLAGVQRGIEAVNARLERMEQALLARPPEPRAAPSTRSIADRFAELETSVGSDADEMIGAAAVLNRADDMPMPRAAAPRADTMPMDPAAERPLVDRSFADPVRTALATNGASPRRQHPGLDQAVAPAATPELRSGPTAPLQPASPHFDPATVERPPAPRSSFSASEADFGGAQRPAATAAAAPMPASAATTSTFIAAARRAAHRQNEARVAEAQSSSSLIGRALARFQSGDAEPVPAARAEPRVLAGDKPVREEKPARPSLFAKVRSAADREGVAAPDVAMAAAAEPHGERHGAAPEDDVEPAESFLTRHRRPILLAVAVIALSFLTLNLVGQRLSAPRAPEAPTPTALDQPAAQQGDVSTAPRQIPRIDSLATGSIDPAASRGFARTPVPSELPLAFAPAAPAPNAAAAASTALATVQAASFQPVPEVPQPTALFDLPDEAVGPLALREAAASGDARAQFEVAAILTEGRVVPEDLEAAATWYTRAAMQGFAPAQYRLGSLYEQGRGVTKDPEQARLWYQRAADAGNRMSMHNLAAVYAGGDLGKQDFAAAAQWFEKAARLGLADSQFNLGMLYARGLGVPQDFAQSYAWFTRAARHGDGDAAKARDDVARSLDAATVTRLAAEAEAWTAEPFDLAANFAPIGTWSRDFDPGLPVENRDVVRSVQAALVRLGFDVGTPDGVPGPRTAEAIKAFERATGMSESGGINPRLLAVLGSQPV